MLHECRATYILWQIGTQKTTVTFISKFDPRKDQFRVKLGQIKSNFKIHKFLIKTCLSYPVYVSGFRKCDLFLRTSIRNAKSSIPKSDVITFTCFFLPLQSNIKILLWKFVCVLFVCSFTTYILYFWITPKFWIL